jgi:hypothetical protein
MSNTTGNRELISHIRINNSNKKTMSNATHDSIRDSLSYAPCNLAVTRMKCHYLKLSSYSCQGIFLLLSCPNRSLELSPGKQFQTEVRGVRFATEADTILNLGISPITDLNPSITGSWNGAKRNASCPAPKALS